jgi:hypothetical protein
MDNESSYVWIMVRTAYRKKRIYYLFKNQHIIAIEETEDLHLGRGEELSQV